MTTADTRQLRRQIAELKAQETECRAKRLALLEALVNGQKATTDEHMDWYLLKTAPATD